jgi:hypothetical protein
MKTRNILLIIVAGLLVMIGCEQLPEGPFLKSTLTPPVLTAPTGGTSYILTEATENNLMAKFTWDAADYGFEAAVTYTLQVTITGDFKDANDIGVTSKTELEILNSKMNSTLLILGAEPLVAATVKCRVKAVINPAVTTIYSDTSTLTVTPFEKIIIYPKLYVPGNYQGWSPNNENTVISSVKSDEKYEGFLYMDVTDPEFKLLKVPAWEEANTIGDPDASGTSGNLQIGSWGGNNIKATGGPGYFRIKADLIEAKYSWVKTDWGLIGSATPGGWGSDQDLTYNSTDDIWTITVDLIVGEMKFRANDGWDINFGDDGGDKKLEYNGANIAVAVAGNYTITLDLGNPVYKYKIVKN